MGSKLDPQQMELYRATDEILHYVWDPIGISEEPNARDEYHNYLPQIFKMLIDQRTEEMIVEHLVKIEAEAMGLKPNKEKAMKVAKVLYEYKEKIFNPAL